MSEEYIRKHLKINSLSKIKLNRIDDFVTEHLQQLTTLDPSIADWNKHIKSLRNTAIKKNKDKKPKKPTKKEASQPEEETTPAPDADDADVNEEHLLTSLREQIVSKLQIKEWTSSSDFLSFYNGAQGEYQDLTEDDLDSIPPMHRDMIKLYTHLWKVTVEELFSEGFSIEKHIQKVNNEISTDMKLKYFNKEKNYAKWEKNQPPTRINHYIQSYGIHIKDFFSHLIDRDIPLPEDSTESETIFRALTPEEVKDEEGPTYSPGSPPPRKEKYSYEEQVQIITDFYKKVDPSKTEEECRDIINRRRNKEAPMGTKIPTKPWLELCEKLFKKYGVHPLFDMEDTDDLDKEEITTVSDLNVQTVSVHRKAFVDWVNQDFYQYLQRIENDSPLNIYQLLVQKYLSVETPYRGLLVYHGLGTGKTATAISLAEGLSSQMKINTMLPASLRTEFIKEIQKWGTNELNKDNLWKYYSIQTLLKDNMMDEIKTKYLIDQKIISQIVSQSQKSLKQKIIQSTEITDHDSEIAIMIQKTKDLKGVWLPDKNGKSLESYEVKKNTETKDLLPEYQQYEKEMILQQINLLIEKKYNFIHYNPFPKFKDKKDASYEEGEDEENEDQYLQADEQEKMNTHNQKMVVQFEKQLKYNIKRHNISSPFYKEVVIIDEVHNFVRAILNGRKPAQIMYDWIVNAKDIKLVFLSGTPVINKPSEIAILYNMLKGLIHIYHFTIKTDTDIKTLNQQLTHLFYDKSSPIELFFIQKKQGKVILSVIQETSGFESLFNKEKNVVYTVHNNNSTFKDLLSMIYKKLHTIIDKNKISPSQEEINQLSDKDMKSIIRGKQRIFDKDINLVFNQKQTLFTMNENNKSIDMTNNEEFMKYFFESTLKIPHQKRTLLKRMLMGLTSYYPIDRSNIVDMPTVIDPTINHPMYQSYLISNQMNIVPCMMSQVQFEKYAEVWTAEKSMDLFKRMSGRNMYDSDNETHHYQIRTRQTCNMIYHEDDFRMKKKKLATLDNEADDEKKRVYDSLLMNRVLQIEKELNILSPKMYEIMKNISKYMDRDNQPTGKILFYSDFRSDAGSEAFELILKSNGYEKFDPMNPQTTKAKRYTFITGSESNEEKRLSKAYFNDEYTSEKKNKFGEYLQIMIITSSGAEGISLTCVRQVHILEPYWNYVRINQVFGRAIRMRSHIDLVKDHRNVEQYIYLSMIPSGDSIQSVYQEIKDLKTWNVPEFQSENIKSEIGKSSNKQLKEMIDMIIKINNDTNNKSADQLLFDIMEKKYTISTEINDIIKESSLDCIPHTRDDPYLNDKCIRFDDKLIHEISYFPGMGLQTIEQADIIQLKSKIYHVKPDFYIVTATDKQSQKNIYIYYQTDTEETDIDIRYLRENAKRICDININEKIIYLYTSSKHEYNSKLGKEFSVYQEIYSLSDHIYDNFIQEDSFVHIDQLTDKNLLHGYKLKDNVFSTYYFISSETLQKTNSILRMYLFDEYEKDSYQTINLTPRVIFNGQLYIQNTSQ